MHTHTRTHTHTHTLMHTHTHTTDGPVREEGTRRRTFRTKAETEKSKNITSTVVLSLLLIACVVSVVCYTGSSAFGSIYTAVPLNHTIDHEVSFIRLLRLIIASTCALVKSVCYFKES